MVGKLGWFETTFAMAGRTCREAVERVPSARAVLTEEEREQLEWSETSPLAVAVMEGDVEALEWLMLAVRRLARLLASGETIVSLTWPPSEENSRA